MVGWGRVHPKVGWGYDRVDGVVVVLRSCSGCGGIGMGLLCLSCWGGGVG